MKKTTYILFITFIVILLGGCGTMQPGQLQQPPHHNARIGVVAFAPQPSFVNAIPEITLKNIFTPSDNTLPTYTHSIKNYSFTRSTVASVTNLLKQTGKYRVIPLYYNHRGDPNQFLRNAIKSNKLDYLVDIEPGVYSENNASSNVFITISGLGILYTWYHSFGIGDNTAKAFAEIDITVTDKNQQTLATGSYCKQRTSQINLEAKI